MNSQDSDCILQDISLNDFVDPSLFKEINEDMSELISSLDENMSHSLKYNIMQKLVNHMNNIPIQDVENKVFQYLLPNLKNLFLQILKENSNTCSILASNELDQVQILKDCLQLCINIMDLLNNIACYILSNTSIQLLNIKSFPVSVAVIVLSTFNHCKNTKDVYLSVGGKNEIIILFKKAQDVHLRLIQILKINVKSDICSETETLILQEMLHIFGEIGEALLDVNLKSSADNWIAYLNISQKYLKFLNNNFNIQQPVKFLTSEILNNLNKIAIMNPTDTKSQKHIIKVTSFLINVINRLLEIFKSHVNYYDLLNFYVQLFNYCNPTTKLSVEKVIDINKELLISYALADINCVKILEEMQLDINKFPTQEYGFFVLLIKFFDGLSHSNPIDYKRISVYKYLNFTFQCLEKYSLELFYKVPLNVFLGDDLFDELILNLASVIVIYGAQEYAEIENKLFEKLVHVNIWSALLASEIWLLVLRLHSPDLACQTLCNIIQKLNAYMKSNISLFPKNIMIKKFIKQIFQRLPEEYKNNVIVTYPVLNNLHVWRCIGVENFPNSSVSSMNELVFKCISLIELFLNDNINKKCFLDMCQMWQIISTVGIVNIHTKKIYAPLLKLWERHNWHEDLQNYIFYNYYMSCLITVTSRFITSMSNSETLLIIKQIKENLVKSNYCHKECTMLILESLANKAFSPQIHQSHLIITLSQILNILLEDSNPIIKQRSLELLHKYFINSPHETIVQKAAYSLQLQDMLTSFYERKINCNNEEFKLYIKKYLNSKFIHKCIDDCNYVPKSKRLKLDVKKDVMSILDRMKTDVKLLKETSKKTEFNEEIKLEIATIVNGIQTLV